MMNNLKPKHCVADVCKLFNNEFAATFNTRLLGGASEPLYQPATTQNPFHIIHFTHDYFASALHEVAHWCIAGEHRRTLVDYGYWYEPDGRTPQQQNQFEKVECKPQALEWMFCQAAQFPFRISVDNLAGNIQVSGDFKQAILQQAKRFCAQPLNKRAHRFAQSLANFYGGKNFMQIENYQLNLLA